MKIIFLIRSLEQGGAERQLILLAQALKKRGHPVTVFVFYGGGLLEQELIASQVDLVVLEKKGRWDFVAFIRRLLLEIKKQKPDVLYSFLTISNLFSLLCRLFFPSMKIIWGLRASNMDLSYYDWTSRCSYLIEKKLAFLADSVIANSYAGKEYALQSGFSKKVINVIPNGIDVSRFKINPSIRKELRNRWNIAEDEKLVGMIARFDPMKDYHTFFETASLLTRRREHIRFLCKGRGPSATIVFLKKKAEELNLSQKMIWIEEGEDSERVYNALDLFCLTSAFGEGFSNVLGEAMACGIPCVATHVGDAALILGGLGEIVPIRSPEIMAEKCDHLLSIKVDPYGLRQRIIDNFSVESMVQKTEGVLKEVFRS